MGAILLFFNPEGIGCNIGILDIGISALNSKYMYRYFCCRHYQFCIMYNNFIQHILNF